MNPWLFSSSSSLSLSLSLCVCVCVCRSKGIFAIEGTDDKFVFQGVHMMMTMSTSAEGQIKPWGEGEKRVNKIVFIGKNLDRDDIKTSFEGCVVKKK